MPGRKSNLSTVTNGDEESPAPTGRAAREGSSVEVSRNQQRGGGCTNRCDTGSSPAANYDLTVSKGCSTTEHINP